RVYAAYEVNSRLSDTKIHSIIDKLNPNLRSIETFAGKKRVREFYAMSAEDAYEILEAIAEIHGFTDKLVKYDLTEQEREDDESAEEIDLEHKERLAPFRFSLCGIKEGEMVEFCHPSKPSKYNGHLFKVEDDKHVVCDDKSWTLSGLAGELSGVDYDVPGPHYFKYKGEWLNDIRKRLRNWY
ncbi:MAG TPA: hypothetical protein O0W90_04490, partial [Methanocorpusculum sp.]|nr:hypothetical protein [Methanocorpusculum sp.]